MIVDAASLVRYFDRTAEGHWEVAGELEFVATFEQLVISPFVIAHIEGAIIHAFGMEGWLAVLEELARGAWTIAAVGPAHLGAMRAAVEAGQSLAEASVAVLAEGADS